MKKLLFIVLPVMVIYGCASTSSDKKDSCELDVGSAKAYTGESSECTCEAQSVLYKYANQINTQGIIEIDYSSDNELHAQSCKKAILAKDKGLNIKMVPQGGAYIYGYHYPMSKFTW